MTDTYMATIDLEKLSADLKEAEARLNVFLHTLDLLEIRIAQFTAIESRIVQNLSFLKKEGVITSASEYKKIKTDLLTAKAMLSKEKMDKDNIEKVKKEIEEYIKKVKRAYSTNVIGPNNVLKFRGKNGRK